MITQQRLKQILHYDPQSGMFTWLPRLGSSRSSNVFNARYAGKQAGYLTKAGYVRCEVGGKGEFAHRLAWVYMTGNEPVAMIDHENGNRSDNRFANLREATRSQNNANSRGRRPSGLKGAYPNKRGSFVAAITSGGKSEQIGTFPTAELANAAYARRASEIHGEYARGR